MHPSDVFWSIDRVPFKLLSTHFAFEDDRGPVRVGCHCWGTVAYHANPHGHYDLALVQPRIVEAAEALWDLSVTTYPHYAI